MNLIKSYKEGLFFSARSFKMISFIYIVTLMMALILSVPFRSVISGQAGGTMALDSLVKHFDFTSYSDFLRQAAKSVAPLISAALWMGGFYLLFTVFFTGGVLDYFTSDRGRFSFPRFLESSGRYFGRFFRLALYFIILQLILAFVIYLPLGIIIVAASKTVSSEASLFYMGLTGVIVHLLLFIFTLTASDYAKIMIFSDNSKKVFITLLLGIKFAFKKFFGVYSLYILLLVFPVVLTLLYFITDSAVGMVSPLKIFIMFLIQQAVVWLRVFAKIWILGSEFSFFNSSAASGFQIHDKNRVDIKEAENNTIAGSQGLPA